MQDKFSARLQSLQNELSKRSCVPETVTYITEVLTEQHREYATELARSMSEYQGLLEYVHKLEVC